MINEVAKYPAIRPEIRTEIEAIDALLYDFTLKIQESARELDQTAIVLAHYLDVCESVRDKLLGLTDCEPHTQRASLPAPPSITDLPADQQRLILDLPVEQRFLIASTCLSVEFLLAKLVTEKGEDLETIMEQSLGFVKERVGSGDGISEAKINSFLKEHFD